jgi:hypothetical protein
MFIRVLDDDILKLKIQNRNWTNKKQTQPTRPSTTGRRPWSQWSPSPEGYSDFCTHSHLHKSECPTASSIQQRPRKNCNTMLSPSQWTSLLWLLVLLPPTSIVVLGDIGSTGACSLATFVPFTIGYVVYISFQRNRKKSIWPSHSRRGQPCFHATLCLVVL